LPPSQSIYAPIPQAFTANATTAAFTAIATAEYGNTLLSDPKMQKGVWK
jgi:hypothetical protein